jgi:hypothetical protein
VFIIDIPPYGGDRKEMINIEEESIVVINKKYNLNKNKNYVKIVIRNIG